MNSESSRAHIEKALENSAKSAKEGRLIVRNVGFNVTKEQLQERFQDYGEIIEVSLPASKRTTPFAADGRRMKVPPHAGYAFVEFDTREQGQAAITAVNGNRLGGRPVAVDFAYDSRLYGRLKKGAEKAETRTESESATVRPVTPVVKRGSESFEKSEAKVARSSASVEASTPVNAPTKVVISVEGEKSARTSSSGESRPNIASTPSKTVTTPKQSVGDEKKSGAPKAPVARTPSSEECKLFLLNVPFDASASDVTLAICEFGKISEPQIRSVLLVRDKEGKPTGRAFVEFSSKEVAEKVADLESSALPEMFGDLYKKTTVTAPIEGVGCVVLGRRISILKALSKAEVEKQKRAKEEADQPRAPKVVNRKLIDLINAGWINEAHPDWEALSPHEKKMRIGANEEKKFKLSNPNFVVNPKRLTVRNVPKTFANGDLKMAIIRALKVGGSKKAKKAGLLRVAIVKDKTEVVEAGEVAPVKEFDMTLSDSEDESPPQDKLPQTALKSKTKKKSRGFAFVDFASMDQALACLQAMNNVAGGFGESQSRRPIVEFSFDDVRKLQIQQQRKEKEIQVKQRAKLNVVPTKVSKKISKKAGRGQKQRAARKARREAEAAK